MATIQDIQKKFQEVESVYSVISKTEKEIAETTAKIMTKNNYAELKDKLSNLEIQLETIARDSKNLFEGQHLTLNNGVLKFKTTEKTIISDEEKAVDVLEKTGNVDCIKTVKTVIKTSVKTLPENVLKKAGIKIDMNESFSYSFTSMPTGAKKSA